ncbi:unnamed protein product [Soboliphyme baturini]|uniref:Protein-S-isoprenylcysteine O-methyltransferase n=1 Tax=Soboliphyme baturini TaxID=241478 RepID=A0A183ISI8_9BILA|nr:unnamed protein product [Soboliphyme baturini]
MDVASRGQSEYDDDADYLEFDVFDDSMLLRYDYSVGSFQQHLVQCSKAIFLGETALRIAELYVATFLLHLLSCMRPLPPKILQVCSGVLGTFVLYRNHSSLLLYNIISFLLVYSTLHVCTKWRTKYTGTMVTFVALSSTAVCQLILPATSFNKILGSVMVLNMKMISVGFDMDNMNDAAVVPDFVGFFGYCFHVGTSLFGPWLSFNNCCTAMRSACFASVLSSIARAAYCGILACCFLLYSSCILDWFLPDELGFYSRVARPLAIELPRSLVDVVVGWNLPMHNFLKNCTLQRYF